MLTAPVKGFKRCAFPILEFSSSSDRLRNWLGAQSISVLHLAILSFAQSLRRTEFCKINWLVNANYESDLAH